MNKSFLVIIVIAVIGTAAAFTISPYFTESTVDEALPSGAIIQPKITEKVMIEKDTITEDIMMEDTITEDTMMEDTIPISYSGTFVGIGDGIHDAQGNAFTIPLEEGGDVLRLENFKSTNGPDLYVYLSTDDKATEFINLGKLKASSGNQNYEIPNDVDLGKYNKVLVWCKAFGVLFGSAEISYP